VWSPRRDRYSLRNFVPHFEAARSNAGPDCRNQTATAESLHARADDSHNDAAPSGMDGRDATAGGVSHQHRNAIRDPNADPKPGPATPRDDGVSFLPSDVAGLDRARSMYLRGLEDFIHAQGCHELGVPTVALRKRVRKSGRA
jgi:hypothetical protein